MSVRAFDNWNSYLDNDGNLLHGKIRFCKKGTTENVIIYNSDGTVALRNPEFTDMLGRTEYQVFVDSQTDVTAYFWKYIGNGDMMGTEFDDYDPARWEYQYSSDNLDPSKVVTLEADTAHGVATMADMREKDPDDVPAVNDTKFLWLYGYYNAGDTSRCSTCGTARLCATTTAVRSSCQLPFPDRAGGFSPARTTSST